MKCALFLKLYLVLLFIVPAEIISQSNPSDSNIWEVHAMYVYDSRVPVHTKPDVNSDTVGFVYYLNKVLVVEKDYGAFGWKQVIYPQKGYVDENFLISEDEKKERDIQFGFDNRENEYSRWTWEVKECPMNYIFIKEEMNEASSTVGLLNDGERFLFIKDGLNGNGVWTKITYPDEGYIETAKMLNESKPLIAVGISYGAVNVLYEKNLKNFYNPVGGVIEFTKTNWDFSFGIGFVYSEARIAQYYLKTKLLSFQVKYRFLHLFDNKLETYVLVGGGYWQSSFQNHKYPALMSSYYKKEVISGPAYSVGGGVIYNLNRFYIEAQYLFYNYKEVQFGKVPAQGEFGNYYRLYTGANHLNIIVGYKIPL